MVCSRHMIWTKLTKAKVQLTAQGNWSYTWNNLPKKNKEGTAYYYRVKEETVPEDFTVTYNYPKEGSQATGVLEGTITLINTKESSFVLPETAGSDHYSLQSLDCLS